MATQDITLPAAGVYQQLVGAGVDFYASNASGHTVYLRSGSTQPANDSTGHPVPPGGRMFRDELITDAIWLMSRQGGAVVRLET